ncbi:MAG TPA: hypothetical protein VGK67_24510 [Myxococcales bacterium]
MSGAAFSPDGKLAATSGKDGWIILWDVATGREVRRLGKSQRWVNTVRFSPSGRYLASGSDNPDFRIWAVETGELLRVVRARTTIVGLAFTPDERMLAVGNDRILELHPLDFRALDTDPAELLEEAERLAGGKLVGFDLR